MPDRQFRYGDEVVYWDVARRQPLSAFSLPEESAPVEAKALSNDGSVLGARGKDQIIRLWQIPSGKPLGSIAEPAGKVETMVFAPNKQLLALGCDDGTVILWDTTSRSED